MSVDLPEPETPLIQVKRPTGILAVTFLRLFPVAPLMVIQRPSGLRRFSGTAIFFLPDKYSPVKELGLFSISVGVPCATI